jgi:hypothetical protein
MHERSALHCLRTMLGTSHALRKATLHGNLVVEQVKLVTVERQVLHITVLILAGLARSLPKLALCSLLC